MPITTLATPHRTPPILPSQITDELMRLVARMKAMPLYHLVGGDAAEHEWDEARGHVWDAMLAVNRAIAADAPDLAAEAFAARNDAAWGEAA